MSLPVTRRTFVLGATALAACSRSERDAMGGAPPRPPVGASVRVVEMDLGRQPWGAGRAVVLVPSWGAAAARYPLLVALHGRGEALKSPAEGAMGWPRDYALVSACDRVRAPPLTPMDYEGLVEPAHLSETNAALFQRPFQGLVVACPYLPDLRSAATADIAAYAHFVLDVLVPAVRAQAPVLSAPEATGIDGVSLGGILALRIGLGAPDRFAAVGAIQPALANAPDRSQSAHRARALRAEPAPGPQASPDHEPRRLLPRPDRGAVPGVDRRERVPRVRRSSGPSRLRVQPGTGVVGAPFVARSCPRPLPINSHASLHAKYAAGTMMRCGCAFFSSLS